MLDKQRVKRKSQLTRNEFHQNAVRLDLANFFLDQSKSPRHPEDMGVHWDRFSPHRKTQQDTRGFRSDSRQGLEPRHGFIRWPCAEFIQAEDPKLFVYLLERADDVLCLLVAKPR